jgi:hypothetical protein
VGEKPVVASGDGEAGPDPEGEERQPLGKTETKLPEIPGGADGSDDESSEEEQHVGPVQAARLGFNRSLFHSSLRLHGEMMGALALLSAVAAVYDDRQRIPSAFVNL